MAMAMPMPMPAPMAMPMAMPMPAMLCRLYIIIIIIIEFISYYSTYIHMANSTGNQPGKAKTSMTTSQLCYAGVTCSKRKRADPVSMSVTLSARLGACSKRQAC